jgi:O-antigen ligase
MPHGLWVAFFAMMCLVSAATLFRVGPADVRPRCVVVTLYLAVVLLFCRSAGPVVYALLLVPVVLIVPRRLQVLLALGMVAVVITYPLLRGLQLIPLDQMVDLASGLNDERGRSLAFRFENEELLLNRAQERPWFGWGGYGRNMLHDAVTGRINVIADGGWIITLGTFGWAGYVTEFGLLALPVFLIAREGMAMTGRDLSPFACTITLLLATNLVDMLPNDTLIPFTWLLAGAVLGHAESLATVRRAARAHAFTARFKPGRTVL